MHPCRDCASARAPVSITPGASVRLAPRLLSDPLYEIGQAKLDVGGNENNSVFLINKIVIGDFSRLDAETYYNGERSA